MGCNDFLKYARDKILIEKPVTVDDDYGGQTVTWKRMGNPWAWVKPVSGNQYYTNEKLTSRVTHKALIRYMASLSEQDTAGKGRITLDGKVMQIDYVECLDEDMKNYGRVFMRLHCIENGQGNDG